MNTYTTADVAAIIGVHPNTVRMYEAWGLIPRVERKANGYRVFTDFHIDQLRLARIAFQVEVLQNGLRKKAVKIIKLSAGREFDQALALAGEYISQIRTEQRNAQEAVVIAGKMLSGQAVEPPLLLTRKEVSDYLDLSMETLRNWERNGLLQVTRRPNGYRAYTGNDIARLKMIRALRLANYSLEAILRLLHTLAHDPLSDMQQVLNTPPADADVVSVCDRLLVSLRRAEENAGEMIRILAEMKEKFS